ncbi:MAG: alpha/beta hydrolase [Prevotella sp.]|jgi:predicted alpha/beta superfamily hydrolase|nr:alpha/beta hydrolase [Prevotella sp.]HMM04117.1 alpha/beta hydrolase-fold protein [Dysgonomonas sp.]
MMKKLFYVLLITLLSSNLLAQDNICIGQKFSMHSLALGEDRPYWVYLPPKYDDARYGKASYPVIYLLDGDTNFMALAAIQSTFTRGMYNNMPECIIVAIPNTDRARDLTPTRSSLKHNGQDLFTNSGGSSHFTSFLTSELRNTIDSAYRTNGYNMLIGHSFGGLYVVTTLVRHTGSFNAYIALDPSLWWDNKVIYKEAQAIWNKTDFEKRYLYIAMAKDENKADDIQKHSETIDRFCTEVLKSAPGNNLNGAWKYYEDENHGTILMPGMFDALRTIFDGIELPVKEIPENPGLIEEYYGKLSERLGFTFIPDENLIDNIGKYAVSVKKTENAIKIFEYNLKNYPDSPNAKKSLSETREKLMNK